MFSFFRKRRLKEDLTKRFISVVCTLPTSTGRPGRDYRVGQAAGYCTSLNSVLYHSLGTDVMADLVLDHASLQEFKNLLIEMKLQIQVLLYLYNSEFIYKI